MNFKPGDVVRNSNSQNDDYYYDIVVTEIIDDKRFRGCVMCHSAMPDTERFTSDVYMNKLYTYVCKIQDYVKGESMPLAHKFKPYDVVLSKGSIRVVVTKTDTSTMEHFTGICVMDHNYGQYNYDDGHVRNWKTDCFDFEYSLAKYFAKE